MKSVGIEARPGNSLLAERARDFLSAGPADVVLLIEHICQLPGAPRKTAEMMAIAIFEGRGEFARDEAGRWALLDDSGRPVAAPAPGAVREPAIGPESALAAPPAAESPAAPAVPGFDAWLAARGPRGRTPRRGETPPPSPLVAAASADDAEFMTSARVSEPRARPVNEAAFVASGLETSQRLLDLPYVVVDVETTGGSPYAGHRVTEIAAVVVRNGEVQEVYETLVNPERGIPPMIVSLTGISWEMVRDQPRFRDVVGDVVGALRGNVFVAHNAAFDWRFVSAEVGRATGERLDGPRLCTVRLARKLLPQLPRRSLDYVARHYGIDITARHRAAGDAIATAHCLVHMLKAAADRGCETWGDLELLLAGGTSGGSGGTRRRKTGRSGMPTPVDRDPTL